MLRTHRKAGAAGARHGRRRLFRSLLVCLALIPGARAADGLRFKPVAGADGVVLNVVESGDAARPTLVLVHGMGQSYLSFENQLRSGLADEFHLVAFDLRGHGNSGKPMTRDAYADRRQWAGDLERVLAATGSRRPVVLGWSYGTVVVMDYLRESGSGSLAGIVLVGSYGGLTPRPAAAAAPEVVQMLNALHRREEGPDLEQNIAAARELARLLTAKTMPDAWVERAALVAMRVPAPVWGYLREQPLGNEDLVPAITAPVLLVVGGKDGGTPESEARALAGRLKQASVTVFATSGHSPFVEEPERFNRELGDFARRALASGGPPTR